MTQHQLLTPTTQSSCSTELCGSCILVWPINKFAIDCRFYNLFTVSMVENVQNSCR